MNALTKTLAAAAILAAGSTAALASNGVDPVTGDVWVNGELEMLGRSTAVSRPTAFHEAAEVTGSIGFQPAAEAEGNIDQGATARGVDPVTGDVWVNGELEMLGR